MLLVYFRSEVIILIEIVDLCAFGGIFHTWVLFKRSCIKQLLQLDNSKCILKVSFAMTLSITILGAKIRNYAVYQCNGFVYQCAYYVDFILDILALFRYLFIKR